MNSNNFKWSIDISTIQILVQYYNNSNKFKNELLTSKFKNDPKICSIIISHYRARFRIKYVYLSCPIPKVEQVYLYNANNKLNMYSITYVSNLLLYS